ncbi:cobalamin biosynthesis protein [Gallaecimonas mangrovi]|uniref:cobalamin biosynthesis protein n=1 Tax=Gallaecimonas mangrovi TaxID=2291597 RepID=UPI00126018D8|nr:hypothetical protein [Gallaecimonas mangrovi]
MLPALPFWQTITRLADSLATKVNKGSAKQQQRAGFFSLVLLWGLVALLAALLSYTADLPLVIDGLAFYLALSDARLSRFKAIEKVSKEQGRTLLATLLKRDCSRYSSEGLYKAAIEGRWRVTKERMLLVLLFVGHAGLIALLIRLWWVLAERWHPARPGFIHFGRSPLAIAWLLRGCGLPLTTFWTVLPLKASALFTRQRPWQLAMLAEALGCQLGGPLLVNGQRIQRHRVGPSAAPQAAHLARLRKLAISGELATALLCGLALLAL